MSTAIPPPLSRPRCSITAIGTQIIKLRGLKPTAEGTKKFVKPAEGSCQSSTGVPPYSEREAFQTVLITIQEDLEATITVQDTSIKPVKEPRLQLSLQFTLSNPQTCDEIIAANKGFDFLFTRLR
ncbi:hypothetical protein L1049_024578 [Liquidambar formosana]|uniref:Uncharacterized protein n=1 Tax=Liquidambar formosana TaxID=63359 RepID=A0AAP0X1D7_LIQFO